MDVVVTPLSNSLAVSPEAVRLVLGLAFCQLLSLLSRTDALATGRRTKYLLSGLAIGYLVYGVHCLHHLLSALGCFLLFSALPWTLASRLNFLYQLGYLVVGYYHNNMTPDYAINWTTSQALLTLKMTGLGFELADGTWKTLPSFRDFVGYTFFPGTYLVGPLDDYPRYEQFMEGRLAVPPFSLGLKRCGHGIGYLVCYLISTSLFPSAFLLSEGFSELALPLRLAYVTIWGHCALYKYLGVWCIAESSCMHLGYTYSGEGRWDGLRNVSTTAFHSATRLQGVIDSWNVNTSRWCGHHIYKRCRPLGSRALSQLLTMVYLSLWHGLHLGYLTTFLQEFAYMWVEKGAARNATLCRWAGLLPPPLATALSWLYTKAFLSFALVGFELYYYDVIMHVYRQLYFVCPAIAAALALFNTVSTTQREKVKS